MACRFTCPCINILPHDPPSTKVLDHSLINRIPAYSPSNLLSLPPATMAQIRGTAGYNLGLNNSFGHPNRADPTRNDPSPLDQIREQTSKIEDYLNQIGEPVKP